MSQENVKLQPLEDDALAKSARHKTVSQSSLYYLNCLNKWESSGFHTVLWGDNKVSPWKSIYYGSGNTPRRNDDPTSRTNLTLPQLANWYIKTGLNFSADYTWREALKAAVGKKTNQTDEERLRSFFARKLSSEDQLEAEVLFQACGRKVPVTVAVDAIGEGGGSNENEEDGNDDEMVDGLHLHHGGGEEGTKKRKLTVEEKTENKKARNKKREDTREGSEPISMDQDRTELRGLMDAGGSREAVFFRMEEILDKYGDTKNGVVKKDWEWLKKLKKSHKNMQQCIRCCHDGVKAAFFLLEGKLAVQKFVCNECNGKK
jgi:hypothetical protein